MSNQTNAAALGAAPASQKALPIPSVPSKILPAYVGLQHNSTYTGPRSHTASVSLGPAKPFNAPVTRPSSQSVSTVPAATRREPSIPVPTTTRREPSIPVPAATRRESNVGGMTFLKMKNQGYIGSGGHRHQINVVTDRDKHNTSRSSERASSNDDTTSKPSSASDSDVVLNRPATPVRPPAHRLSTHMRPEGLSPTQASPPDGSPSVPVTKPVLPARPATPLSVFLAPDSDDATHSITHPVPVSHPAPVAVPVPIPTITPPTAAAPAPAPAAVPASASEPVPDIKAALTPRDRAPRVSVAAAGPGSSPAVPVPVPGSGNTSVKNMLASFLGVGRKPLQERDPQREQQLRTENQLFAGSLDHRADDVQVQVEAGMYLMKRVGTFSERIAAAAQKFAEQLQSDARNEVTHLERAGLDQCSEFVAAYKQMQDATLAFASVVDVFAQQVVSAVANPLTDAYREGDAKRKTLRADQVREQADLTKLEDQLARTNSKCRAVWTQIQSQERENVRAREVLGFSCPQEDSANNSNAVVVSAPAFLDERIRCKALTALRKNEKLVQELRDKGAKEFSKCVRDVEQTRAAQERFHHSVVPDLMREYEALERSRLTRIREALCTYTTLFAKLSESAPLTRQFSSAARDLDVRTAMQAYVAAMRTEHGPPPGSQPARDELPCAPDALVGDDWRLSLDVDFGAAAEAMSAPQVYRCDSGWAPSSPRANSLWLPKGAYVLVTNRMGSPKSTKSRNSTGFTYSNSAPRLASGAGSLTAHLDALQPSTPIAADPLDVDADEMFGELITTPKHRIAEGTRPTSSEPLTPTSSDGSTSSRFTSRGFFPSHAVAKVLPDDSVPLAYILCCPELLALFREHLASEFSLENLDFWAASRSFRTTWDSVPSGSEEAEADTANMSTQALTIMREYVFDDAPRQVNLRGNIQMELLDAVDKSLYHPLMFTEAEEEIYNLLSRDSLSRFKKSAKFCEKIRSASFD